MFALAMLMYTADTVIGLWAFTVVLDSTHIIREEDGYKGYSPKKIFTTYLRDYLKPRPFLAGSYVAGTSPQNGYTFPEGPLRFELSRNPYSVIAEDRIKVFNGCSGADSPRPLIMKRNSKGIWKVDNYSSVFVGIRQPVLAVEDPL